MGPGFVAFDVDSPRRVQMEMGMSYLLVKILFHISNSVYDVTWWIYCYVI